MHCRIATDDDVDALAALRRAWTEEDTGAPIADAGFEERFRDWCAAERDRRRWWIADDDRGDAVGMLSVIVITRMPRPGRPTRPWGYVHNLFVLPAVRNAGVGRELMGEAIAACRAEGFERLVLHPRQRTIPFYARLGFTPVDDLLRLPLSEGKGWR